MPSRCHQLQQLVATRRRQQQLPQTNVENGKLLSVFRRSKAGGHGQGPIRPARSGGTESSHHGKGWLPLTPSAGMEAMGLVFFLGGMVPYREKTPRVTVRSLFFETAETLTFYLDIILFKNVPAQIADGVHLLHAAASLTFPQVHPGAGCVTR